MISTYKVCKKCGSEHIVKNGCNSVGNPKYKCKSCVFESRRPSEETKALVLKAAQERSSSRGLSRVFGISHQTVLNWIKKKQSNSLML